MVEERVVAARHLDPRHVAVDAILGGDLARLFRTGCVRAMTGGAFGVVCRGLGCERGMRVVTTSAGDAAVAGEEALAIGEPVRLEAHISRALNFEQHDGFPGTMARSAEFIRFFGCEALQAADGAGLRLAIGDAIHSVAIGGTEDPDLFVHERYGHFEYAIPVDAGIYALSLHFAEAYFGPANEGGGGAGSRVFDVFCNGAVLLRNFDIFREAGMNRALIKTFHGLIPNAQGKLVVTFVPVKNYASLYALEVADETQ
jgi:hypothetical protein